MPSAIDEFRANIVHVNDLIGLGQVLAATTPGLDVSEIYRSALAMAVSAMDRYVHEKTLHEMMAVHRGARPTTNAFERFSVTLAAARFGIADVLSDLWLEGEIRQAHSLKAFQKTANIADAVRLFSAVELWNAVAAVLVLPAADVKTQVDLTVDRRNQIVHEFDCDPIAPGARWPMDDVVAKGGSDFITSVVEAIEVVV